MAAFRSNCSRRVLGGLLILGSFVFLGASFAPSSPYTPSVFDPADPVLRMDLPEVSGLADEGTLLAQRRTLDRLEEWVLAHRMISVAV